MIGGAWILVRVLPGPTNIPARVPVPVASPRHMQLFGFEPHRDIETDGRFIASWGASMLPEPPCSASSAEPRADLELSAPPAPNHGGPYWPVQRHSRAFNEGLHCAMHHYQLSLAGHVDRAMLGHIQKH